MDECYCGGCQGDIPDDWEERSLKHFEYAQAGERGTVRDDDRDDRKLPRVNKSNEAEAQRRKELGD